MSAQLTINNACLAFGNTPAIDRVSFTLRPGALGCLLGPSGCGKTSLLRAIAGFEKIDAGSIALASRKVSHQAIHIQPEKRNVGMVFQDFALFPHLNVEKNVGFGLHKLPASERDEQVQNLLALVGMTEKAKVYPHQLSGGQQQRIALIRALAPKPDILLLDEPFSNLDAELRTHLAGEVRSLLKQHGTTALLVTHDQHEAFAIADNIGVMRSGNLLQWDSAYQLYHNPCNQFVANFIGEGCVVNAYVNQAGELENGLGVLTSSQRSKSQQQSSSSQWKPGNAYEILLRPDDLLYAEDSNKKFKISEKYFRGAEYFYRVELPDGQQALCAVPSHIDMAIGQYLPIKLDLEHCVVFEKP